MLRLWPQEQHTVEHGMAGMVHLAEGTHRDRAMIHTR
jgi:hypothetical protein